MQAFAEGGERTKVLRAVAGRHGFPAWLLEAVRDRYVRAPADGHGDDDMAAVAEVSGRGPS